MVILALKKVILFNESRIGENFEKKYECSNSVGHCVNSTLRTLQDTTAWKVTYKTHLQELFDILREYIRMKTGVCCVPIIIQVFIEMWPIHTQLQTAKLIPENFPSLHLAGPILRLQSFIFLRSHFQLRYSVYTLCLFQAYQTPTLCTGLRVLWFYSFP